MKYALAALLVLALCFVCISPARAAPPPPPPPVNGACGATAGACAAGTSGGLADDGVNTTWTCTGLNGGTNASCSIPDPINGACGAAVGTCTAGTAGPVNYYPNETWTCSGLNGGTNAPCSITTTCATPPCPPCASPPCPVAPPLPPIPVAPPPPIPAPPPPGAGGLGPMPPWLNNCLPPRGTGVGDPVCPPTGVIPTLPLPTQTGCPGPGGLCPECADCTCIIADGITEQKLIQTLGVQERNTFETLMYQFEQWMVTTWFTNYVLPAMMNMTEFLTSVGMYQVQVFGELLDAKDQMETERLMQSMAADAHARYQPDLDMCNIGTAARGLGAAHRNAEYTAFLLAQRSQDRQLGNANGSGAEGITGDRTDRVQLLKTRFCNIHENDNTYGNASATVPSLCGTTGGPAVSEDRDIDYTRVIDTNMSLNADFSDGAVTGDEQDLIAMENNLFAHTTFDRLGTDILTVRENQPAYLESRAVIAKRSVVENSFLAIAGMRSAGGVPSTNTAPYVAAIFQQMGVPPIEAKLLVGTRPSYYALLEVLAQKIYQNPNFFVNLYDTPANVARKDVAMQAIDLMLDRDTYKSELRSEADMAVWLELELVAKQHNPIQSHLDWLQDSGRHD